MCYSSCDNNYLGCMLIFSIENTYKVLIIGPQVYVSSEAVIWMTWNLDRMSRYSYRYSLGIVIWKSKIIFSEKLCSEGLTSIIIFINAFFALLLSLIDNSFKDHTEISNEDLVRWSAFNPTSHGRFWATPYRGGGHFVPPYFLSMLY